VCIRHHPRRHAQRPLVLWSWLPHYSACSAAWPAASAARTAAPSHPCTSARSSS
jgi:hypothetical protein